MQKASQSGAVETALCSMLESMKLQAKRKKNRDMRARSKARSPGDLSLDNEARVCRVVMRRSVRVFSLVCNKNVGDKARPCQVNTRGKREHESIPRDSHSKGRNQKRCGYEGGNEKQVNCPIKLCSPAMGSAGGKLSLSEKQANHDHSNGDECDGELLGHLVIPNA